MQCLVLLWKACSTSGQTLRMAMTATATNLRIMPPTRLDSIDVLPCAEAVSLRGRMISCHVQRHPAQQRHPKVEHSTAQAYRGM
ncbi:hypothetical protein BV20DRAFT_824308 [Pilatotrama ljubarskyi]|nr:hypothetical protein BV20DRAFT_824308 [Pilatotrama ljubarskyi]